MLFSYKRMIKPSRVIGKDKEIGSIQDLYVEERTWTVRYFVVGGGFLGEKRRFISPASVIDYSIEEERFHVSISEQEAKESPDPDQEPLSRTFEREFSMYYNLNPYWIGGGLWGAGAMPRDLTNEAASDVESMEEEERPLLSIDDVKESELIAENETVGKIKDALIDDQSFTIRYFVVDTKGDGKNILLYTSWVDEVDWTSNLVRVDVSKEKLRDAPEFQTDRPIDRELETSLFKHYGKPKYWD
ncbi:PRC-barrel domain-containing protein [Alteribacter aurantiacus]|uniref:PRC-barrel domain-containing protein n=1 Tax=Alteribacter aurantiacus TaxID=254410 RepID=UPI00047D216F|nr:PRC-barrel domain-containing protein [Alteribacter aurantiacus]